MGLGCFEDCGHLQATTIVCSRKIKEQLRCENAAYFQVQQQPSHIPKIFGSGRKTLNRQNI